MLIPEVTQGKYQGQDPLDDQGQEQSKANNVDISLWSEQVGLVHLPGEPIYPMDTFLMVLPHLLILPHLLQGTCEEDWEEAKKNPEIPGDAEESVKPIVKETQGGKYPAPYLGWDQREQQEC